LHPSFGYTLDEIEYNSDVHTLMLSANFDYSDKLNFNGSIVWNNGKAEMDGIDATSATYVGSAVPGMDHSLALPAWEGYSDLDIDQVEYSLGVVYNYSDSISFNLNGSYFDYNDDDPYLYDTDGDVLSANVGMTMRF